MRALIDTSALLALARTRDQYHARAIRAAERHLSAGGRFLGTVLVLAEVQAHLLRLRGPLAAREHLARLVADPIHEWLAVDPGLVAHATSRWLAKFHDQNFTLADAVSFEVMEREKVSRAFAFDRHFEVAGFELLA